MEGVQALHAGRGQAFVVELAVVVVLDDPALALRRPGRQLEAPFQGHRGTRGVLMRGRDVDGIGAALVRAQPVGAHAFFVHGDRHDLELGHLECLACAEVTRVFHQDRLTRIDQDLGAHEECLPGAGEH
ncbi:hypothetical protein D9M72_488590 [compost metagenome]